MQDLHEPSPRQQQQQSKRILHHHQPQSQHNHSVSSSPSAEHHHKNQRTKTALTDPYRFMTLAVKPHAFAGAVLSPKHAKELTPTLCLAIATALAEQSLRKAAVPYTLWITEAWRVLGWAEPSAALFWEMATMYHTLYLAGRAFAADYQEGMHSHAIPPILSCGSTSSLGSGATPDRTPSVLAAMERKKLSSAASAKELPVWLVGTFLLLHCEEFAFQRNLSGQDERRFYGALDNVLAGGAAGASGPGGVGNALAAPSAAGALSANQYQRVDFTSLFKHSSLSPR